MAIIKVMPQRNKATMARGRMNLSRDMPADLMATNSKLSPKLPKVMMDEKSNANGSAVGTQNKVTNPTSFKTVRISSPLPTRSSIYNQKNCMVKTNTEIAKAAIKGPTKDRIISMSSFFIT